MYVSLASEMLAKLSVRADTEFVGLISTYDQHESKLSYYGGVYLGDSDWSEIDLGLQFSKG